MKLQRDIEELQRKTVKDNKRKSTEDTMLAKAKQLHDALGAFMKAEESMEEAMQE